MTAIPLSKSRNDDPLRMRELLTRAMGLAEAHEVSSVLVGLAANEGDLIFPDIVEYLESALRVDYAIFRMTRERVVVSLADVDRAKAEEIVRRNLVGLREQFTVANEPVISMGFYEVGPGTSEAAVKDVLPALFAAMEGTH